MDVLLSTIFIIVMALFVYVGAVMSEEQRQSKHIPLIWEKEFWKK